MDDIDERLRADIAASLLQAIHFAMSINADPAELASSRIVRTIAELEIERRRVAEVEAERRRLADLPKKTSAIRMPFLRRA